MELKPFDPSDYTEKPNWGVIILTGIAGMLLILSAGFLYQQVTSEFQAATETPLPPTRTRTPEPSPTPVPIPAMAVAVDGSGVWQTSLTITWANGRVETFEESGVGGEVITPDIEQPLNSVAELRADLRVVFSYPQLDQGNVPAEFSLSYPDLFSYERALEAKFFALYDVTEHFIEVVSAAEMQALNNITVLEVHSDP